MSAYSDNPYHVTAICVEEVTEESIIFRFAANTGVHDCLNKGLAAIARILEDEARNGIDAIDLFLPLLALSLSIFLSLIGKAQSTEHKIAKFFSRQRYR